MIVNVGSGNPSKIESVKEVFEYFFPKQDISIFSLDVSSEISEQPRGLTEITLGSRNRAKNSFSNCNYSVGLESGIIELPYSLSGHQDVCVCSIFDGEIYSFGMSGGFEIPREIFNLLEQGMDLSQATRQFGLTEETKIGNSVGIISLLTNGKINRKNQIKQAIEMAMPRILCPQFYK